jgi:hypothetical protein
MDVERPPGQEAGDRVQVGSVDIASQLGRLEGDRAHTGEGIANLEPVPMTALGELLDQSRHGICLGAQIGVDLAPGLHRRAVHLFNPTAIFPLLGVTQGVEDAALQGLPRRSVYACAPPGPLILEEGVAFL